MRSATLLLSLWCSAGLFAQNWALINPAYKYNYSLGGTDTITNQIFATQVDTLGPDSFRYAFNLIGIRCDTCSTSLGSCAGCYMLTGQPQFLGFEASAGAGTWRIRLADRSQLVLSDASVGTTWLFDSLDMITATVSSVIGDSVLGSADSLRTIAFSTNDSIVLSKQFGIVRYPSSTTSAAYQLIGHQTLALGRLIPSMVQMFGLQTGDVVLYSRGYWSLSYPWQEGHHARAKHTIIGRTEFPDHVEYVSSVVQCSGWNTYDYGTAAADQYHTLGGPGGGTWVVPDDMDLPFLDLLGSYPGQVVRSDHDWGSTMTTGVFGSALCIADHRIDSDGRYVIQAKPFPTGNFGDAFSLYTPNDSIAPGLYGYGISFNGFNGFPLPGDQPSQVWYKEGIGLMLCDEPMFESGGQYVLEGAVIGGDTIGTVISDSEFLAVHENTMRNDLVVFPNPADDVIHITDMDGYDRSFVVHDGTGRPVLTGQAQGATFDLPVGTLKPGYYFLSLSAESKTGRGRFMIVR